MHIINLTEEDIKILNLAKSKYLKNNPETIKLTNGVVILKALKDYVGIKDE